MSKRRLPPDGWDLLPDLESLMDSIPRPTDSLEEHLDSLSNAPDPFDYDDSLEQDSG